MFKERLQAQSVGLLSLAVGVIEAATLKDNG